MTAAARRLRILALADAPLVVVGPQMAKQVGLGPGPSASLAIAVSELAVNVAKYAGSGVVTLRAVQARGLPGIEVLVEDKGPGIADLDFAMRDHASTGGTLGLGLPGARRLVDEFEITSRPGEGTRVRIVKWG